MFYLLENSCRKQRSMELCRRAYLPRPCKRTSRSMDVPSNETSFVDHQSLHWEALMLERSRAMPRAHHSRRTLVCEYLMAVVAR